MIRLRIFWAFCWLTLLTGSGLLLSPPDSIAEEPNKHALTIDVPAAATPGVHFDWLFSITPGEIDGPMDLYAPFISPDGVLRFLLPTTTTEIPVPYLSDLAVQAIETDFLSNLELSSSLQHGEYLFGALLVTAGQDPFNDTNWASNLPIGHFHYASLSPHQQAFVNEVGYPDVFLKTFSREENGTLRVDEIWLYDNHDLSEYFVNGVFVQEEIIDSSGITITSTPYHPEQYRFDSTRAEIEMRHGKPLSVYEGVPTGHAFFEEFPANTYLIYDGLIVGFKDNTLMAVLGLE